MNRYEISEILNSYKKAYSRYESALYQLVRLRYDLQGIKATVYDTVRVQGGKDSDRLENLIDKETQLSDKVIQLRELAEDCADNVRRLIELISNKDCDCDILTALYIQRSDLSAVAKRYGYSYESTKNKVWIAKKKLVAITTAKGITKKQYEI